MSNLSQRFSSARIAVLAVAASAFLGGGVQPAAAHHAFAAEFDSSQALELKGTVTKVQWVNPHSWLYFDVADDKGNVTNWGVEFSTPSTLTRLGLTRADVAVGTLVAISGYKSKNGGPFGYSVKVTLPDGRTFQTGQTQDAIHARAE